MGEEPAQDKTVWKRLVQNRFLYRWSELDPSAVTHSSHVRGSVCKQQLCVSQKSWGKSDLDRDASASLCLPKNKQLRLFAVQHFFPCLFGLRIFLFGRFVFNPGVSMLWSPHLHAFLNYWCYRHACTPNKHRREIGMGAERRLRSTSYKNQRR